MFVGNADFEIRQFCNHTLSGIRWIRSRSYSVDARKTTHHAATMDGANIYCNDHVYVACLLRILTLKFDNFLTTSTDNGGIRPRPHSVDASKANHAGTIDGANMLL